MTGETEEIRIGPLIFYREPNGEVWCSTEDEACGALAHFYPRHWDELERIAKRLEPPPEDAPGNRETPPPAERIDLDRIRRARSVSPDALLALVELAEAARVVLADRRAYDPDGARLPFLDPLHDALAPFVAPRETEDR